MSLLTICQKAASSLKLPKPLSLIGSTDETNQRLLEMAQEEGQDLAYRSDWNKLVLETVFTTDGTGEYDLETIAPAFDYMTTSQVWDRSNRRDITFINPDDWQTDQSWGILNVYNQFRIRGGDLLIYPALASGEELAFEYMSRAFCKSNTGTPQREWEADTDTGTLDEDIMKLGVVWRYRKLQGFAYQDDLALYERRVSAAIQRDKSMPNIHLGGTRTMRGRPTMNIPETGVGQ
jgi:hypothetical protein